ncbi:hypothetical protein HNR40_010350, partial [Nonomuraea endophytica]|nr:hypothetical protein [Nonomuraea endophytica]
MSNSCCGTTTALELEQIVHGPDAEG